MKFITHKFNAAIEAAVSKRLNEIEKKVEVAHSLCNDAESATHDNSVRIDNLEPDIANLSKKVEEFGEEANNRIEEIDSNVSDLDSKVDDLDSTVSDLNDKVENIESAEYIGSDYLDERINELESELSDKMQELVSVSIDERKIEIAKEQVESIVKEAVADSIKQIVTKDFILALLATK